MDIIKELGSLALASRLKRLTDLLMRDMAELYREVGLDFEPRWFAVFYLLKDHGPLPVMDIAKALGVTHPAVIQITDDLRKRGLLKSRQDKQDGRVRLIDLSEKGHALLTELEPLWEDIRASVNEMLRATGHDVMDTIERLEVEVTARDVRERVLERRKQRQRDAVEILDYQPEFRQRFRALNEEWLRKDFVIETQDVEALSDPEKGILAAGGQVLFARVNGEIVGTCALLRHGPDEFELAKMAVTEKAQGKQIGLRLAQAAIQRAKEQGARVVVLETNSKLAPAVQLYRKLGFRNYRPAEPSKFARTDMFMKLEIGNGK